MQSDCKKIRIYVRGSVTKHNKTRFGDGLSWL